jgi:hypothetical protein
VPSGKHTTLIAPLTLIPAPQLVELLTNVVPNSSLSELAALETILSTLVQQDKLAAPKLVRHLVQDICHYYTKLQSLPQDNSAQQQSQGTAGDGTDEAMADAAPASDAAGADALSGLCRTDCVELLRHFFALLSLLTAAQPSVLEETYVQVLLEVGFSGSLAVSAMSSGWRVLCEACTAGVMCVPLVANESAPAATLSVCCLATARRMPGWRATPASACATLRPSSCHAAPLALQRPPQLLRWRRRYSSRCWQRSCGCWWRRLLPAWRPIGRLRPSRQWQRCMC